MASGWCSTGPPRPLQASTMAFRWRASGGPHAHNLFEMSCLSFSHISVQIWMKKEIKNATLNSIFRIYIKF
jgi:hypothetical protein